MARFNSIRAGPAGTRERSGKAGGQRFRPKKRLGQHFLVDQRIVQKIIHCAGFHASDRVLEIGPGMGSLTLPLAREVHHIVAVEPSEAMEVLKQNTQDRKNMVQYVKDTK